MGSSRKLPGLKVPTIFGALVEDATLYFLVIFTSHLVLEMTILFGRVSKAIPLSGSQQVITNPCHSRNPSDFFQARKSLPTYLTRNHPHHVFRYYTQRHRRVSPTSGLPSLIRLIGGPFQVSPRDGFADNGLVEESRRLTAGGLVP